jgi:hypothetical protein
LADFISSTSGDTDAQTEVIHVLVDWSVETIAAWAAADNADPADLWMLIAAAG